jgi:Protein of unknown function (DUF2911)
MLLPLPPRGAACLAACLVLPGTLAAQIRASERGSVSQTIDGTVITVDYARPRVRGRDPIFGGVVRWQEVWTPGANWATTLEVSKPLEFDGHPVPMGKYSVWFVVDQDHWTLVLDPRHHRYHTEPPDSAAGQVRYVVHPAPAPFTEVLSFSFPVVRADGAVLVFQWATSQVALNLKVTPSHPITISRGQVAGLLGTYRYQSRTPGDSSPPSEIVLAYEDGRLMMHWDHAPFPDLKTLLLIRIADDWFTPATLEDGEVFDVISEWVFEFARSGGTATGFEVRGEGDQVEGVGTRK